MKTAPAFVVPAEKIGVELFDLDSVVNLTESPLQLRHPTSGALTPATILLAGPEHDARKRAQWAIMRRRRAAFAAAGGEMPPPDPEEDEADELAMLVACTLGWSNLAIGGKALEFSAGACGQLYGDRQRAWIRDQVRNALDDRARFIGGSASA